MKAPRGRPDDLAAATAQKWATKLHASHFRATAGRIGGRLVGCPVLLNNAGHKIVLRADPLLYLRDGLPLRRRRLQRRH